MSRIVELQAENVKRIKAVHLKPNPGLNVIGGKNGQGKSSTLDAILYALGGKKHMPSAPVRRGADAMQIVLELDNGMTIKRGRRNGLDSLIVEQAGVVQKSPQSLIDRLIGPISFDPLAFMRLDARKQAELLRDLVGLDTSELDAKRARAFNERTIVNREVERLKALVASAPSFPDAPAEEVSVAKLTVELEQRQQHNNQIADLRREANRKAELVANYETDIATAKRQVQELERQLEAAKSRVVKLTEERADEQTQLEELQDQLEQQTPANVDEVRQQINGAEATNAQVRANRERAKLNEELATAISRSDKLTEEIAAIDEEKRQAIKSASYPIEGLEVGDGEVLLNGLPLEQASQAEMLRTSVAIGMALNADLKVMLVKDGSLLDDESRALLAQMVDAAGYQCFLESVGDDGADVVIVDGEVAKAEAETVSA